MNHALVAVELNTNIVVEKNKNLKEFKELIERYSSITIEEIQKVADEYCLSPYSVGFLGSSIASRLTGYGSTRRCTLCKSIGVWNLLCADAPIICDECTWQSTEENLHCMRDKNYYTYNDIKNSDNPQELLEAFQARAAYMTMYLKSFNL